MANILVIDDDSTTALLVRVALQKGGHEVRHAPSPEEARTLLVSDVPAAIILDVMLPGSSGFELLEELRSSPELSEVPVLMLSSLGESSHRVQGLRLGAADYLTKPFDPDELCLRVEKLLETGGETVDGLQGILDEFPFAELLQSLAQSRRSGLLELPRVKASLLLDRGEIAGAIWPGLEGRSAALSLCDVARGHFRFTKRGNPAPEAASKKIFSVSGLLMTHAVLEDELQRRRGFLPEPQRWLEAQPAELPPLPETLEDLPVRDLYLHLLDQPRATLEELLAAGLGARIEVELGVAWLAEEGLVKEVDRIAAEERSPAGQLPRRILLLYSEAAWSSLIEALSSDAAEADNPGWVGLRDLLEQRRGGTGWITFGDQPVTLHVQELSASSFSRLKLVLSICDGLLVWVGEGTLPEAEEELIQSLLPPVANRSALLLAPQGLPQRLRDEVSARPDWQLLEQPEERLSRLLLRLEPTASGDSP